MMENDFNLEYVLPVVIFTSFSKFLLTLPFLSVLDYECPISIFMSYLPHFFTKNKLDFSTNHIVLTKKNEKAGSVICQQICKN